MERLRTKILALGIFVVVLVLLAAAINEWRLLGIHQGYEPDQPIAYSHKVHAGDHKIPCLYCHFGAEKSRHAGIPPTNVCMNCHEVIKKDSSEIAKIKKALEEKKPIQWIKVHNLPDFVYFNHSQHVNGGIPCQDCHGPVEAMTRLRQESTLTMGWCINCHREKGITPPSGHDNLAAETKSDTRIVIGGLDCGKCHH